MSVIEKFRKYFNAAQSGLVLTSVEPEPCLHDLAGVTFPGIGVPLPIGLAGTLKGSGCLERGMRAGMMSSSSSS